MEDSNGAATQELVSKLDSLVPRKGARVRLSQYRGGPDESRVVANRRGYLRLGIEFLKAAYVPDEKRGVVNVDIEYLLTGDSDVGFDWFERREDFPKTSQSPIKRSGIGAVIGIVLIGLGILCALVGLVTIVQWFL